MKKRTQAQLDFDLAKHGWAFCNAEMLRGRISRCELIAARLAPDDPRHQEIPDMFGALASMDSKGKAMDSKQVPAEPEKRVAFTIDLTPKWVDVLPMLLDAVTEGKTPEGRKKAREELIRLAHIADTFNACQNWNYDLTQAPTLIGKRILGLWHNDAPERSKVMITWLAQEPNSGYRYLVHDGSDFPHYVPDPDAFVLIPPLKPEAQRHAPGPSAFAEYLRTKAIIHPNRMASRSVQLKAALLNSPLLDRVHKETNLTALATQLGFTRKEAKVVWEGFRATSKRKRSKHG